MNGIADTGFLVAFARKRDLHHGWAVEIAHSLREPLLTCEAVLAEAAFHLGSTSYVLGLVADGLLAIAFQAAQHLGPLARLARKYEDRAPDLADLCLIRMSEMHPRHAVVTTDVSDFRVYRRFGRDVIPLVCPR